MRSVMVMCCSVIGRHQDEMIFITDCHILCSWYIDDFGNFAIKFVTDLSEEPCRPYYIEYINSQNEYDSQDGMIVFFMVYTVSLFYNSFCPTNLTTDAAPS